MQTSDQIIDNVKEYYGTTLQSTKDLQTQACCTSASMPVYLRPILKEIHPDILNRFYGCGSPIPEAIDNAVVLDLGCGTGRDVYLLSKLVGENGKAIGVDMSKEQLTIAKTHIQSQTETFGYKTPNVEFKLGQIEDLQQMQIKDNSIDAVVSNCVINLSTNKEAVFKEIFRVLKPGGELYFSDVYSSRRLPESLKSDPVLYGECLGGALYTEDFRRLLTQLGCSDYHVIDKRVIGMTNDEIAKKVGQIMFYSMTVRAFKLPDLEDTKEDYGQIATYLGTIKTSPNLFRLSDNQCFEKGKPTPVCGNTASMLQQTRYAPHFKVDGDRSTHYGLFDIVNETTNSRCAPVVGSRYSVVS